MIQKAKITPLMEVLQFTGEENLQEVITYLMNNGIMSEGNPSVIRTQNNGGMTVRPGEWVIKGAAGNIFSVTQTYFDQNYEIVEEGAV